MMASHKGQSYDLVNYEITRPCQQWCRVDPVCLKILLAEHDDGGRPAWL